MRTPVFERNLLTVPLSAVAELQLEDGTVLDCQVRDGAICFRPFSAQVSLPHSQPALGEGQGASGTAIRRNRKPDVEAARREHAVAAEGFPG